MIEGKIKVTIGRSSQCDYVIENLEQHGTVSGKHATIWETEAPNYFLYEDHSTNGSYINGQLLHNSTCKITISDHITLGKTYNLPIDNILRNYFIPHRIIKKQNQDIYQQNVLTESVSNNFCSSDVIQSCHNLDRNNDFTAMDDNVMIVEKVSRWYWIFYILSIIIAFCVGFCFHYVAF